MSRGRRQVIIVNEKSEVRDEYGHPTETWSEYCVRRCNVKTLPSKEVFRDDMDSYVTIDTLVIDDLRYDRKTRLITHDMQVVMDGVTYEIGAPPVNIDHRNKFIMIVLKRFL